MWGKEHANMNVYAFFERSNAEKAPRKAWFLYGNIGYILTVQKI